MAVGGGGGDSDPTGVSLDPTLTSALQPIPVLFLTQWF
jgi:hypothetical protein